jgi:two-component system alkaline phosphatase synthesis response regulator PhoP
VKRILVVEDEPEMLLGLKDNLELEGYQAIGARDGEEGLRKALAIQPDAIILDLMLPKLSGFEVCRSLRASGQQAPILMLTARSLEAEKVRGLELGADDYVTKPFSINELLARIRALLRRAGRQPEDLEAPEQFRSSHFQLDFRRMKAWKNRKALVLTSLEFEVLRYLIARLGEAVSREELLRDVWGYRETMTTRTVDNLMAHLRKKLERRPNEPEHILTVHGIGYRFVD